MLYTAFLYYKHFFLNNNAICIVAVGVLCTMYINFNHLFQVKFQGLTGEVQFNPRSGERRVHSGLDLLNIKEFVVPNSQQHEKQVRVQKVCLLG